MTISSPWHIWYQSEIETLAMPSKKIVITCSQEPTSPPTLFSVRFHRGPPHCLLEQKQRQKWEIASSNWRIGRMESGNFVVAWKLGGVKEWRNTCLNSSWLGINLPSMDCMCRIRVPNNKYFGITMNCSILHELPDGWHVALSYFHMQWKPFRPPRSGHWDTLTRPFDQRMLGHVSKGILYVSLCISSIYEVCSNQIHSDLLFVDENGTWDTCACISINWPRRIQHFTPTVVMLVVEDQKPDGSCSICFWGAKDPATSLTPWHLNFLGGLRLTLWESIRHYCSEISIWILQIANSTPQTI